MESQYSNLLQQERDLEILTTGVPVQFYEGDAFNYPCFVFDHSHIETVNKWKNQPFLINFYFPKGLRQVINSIDQDELFVYENGLFVKDRKTQAFRHGYTYIMAKNNPTISVLTRVLSNPEQVNQQIYSFINDNSVKQISSNYLFPVDDNIVKGLNPSQIEVLNLVTRERISFIKGPPGCGKTKTMARLAYFFSKNNKKIIIGAVSNAAIIAITKSLILDGEVLNYKPNITLFLSGQAGRQNKIHSPEIQKLTFRYKFIQKYLQMYPNNLSKNALSQILIDRKKNKLLNQQQKKDFEVVYNLVLDCIHQETQIFVCTTISSFSNDLLLRQHSKPFIGILDEAAQASWGDTFCFLIKGVEKMVLIGDQKQLGPTVISGQEKLKQTIFTKLNQKNPKYFRLLNEQYRMHPFILEFPNKEFYENKIKNGVTEKDRESIFPYFKKYPVSFIDCNTPENQEIQTVSKKRNFWNSGQIEIIRKILNFFPKDFMKNVGIISPYDLQIQKIKQTFSEFEGLSVKTCDGYQGSEKQYIIFSCVRSNPQGNIGFCNSDNRFNVSVTRARRGLIVIGNTQTYLKKNETSHIWHKFIPYLQIKQFVLGESQIDYFKPFTKDAQTQKLYERYQKGLILQENNNPHKQLEREVEQIQNEDLQLQQLNENPLVGKKIEVVKIPQDDEEQILKIYKQLKKSLKSLFSNLKKCNKQLQKEIQSGAADDKIGQYYGKKDKLKEELEELIKNGVSTKIKQQSQQSNENTLVLKLLPRQLSFFYETVEKLQSENFQNSNKNFDKILQKLMNEVLEKAEKDDNNIREENQNIMKAVDLSIYYCLRQNLFQ